MMIVRRPSTSKIPGNIMGKTNFSIKTLRKTDDKYDQ